MTNIRDAHIVKKDGFIPARGVAVLFVGMERRKLLARNVAQLDLYRKWKQLISREEDIEKMGRLSGFFPRKETQKQISAEDCCAQGKKTFELGRFVEAMEYFQAAIEKDSHYEEAYQALIDTYRVLGREQDVQKTIQKLQTEIPNHSPITAQRKQSIVSSGDNKQSTSKRKIANPVLKETIAIAKKICSSISTISGAKMFRLLLYTITTINVIQIMAAITRVTTWGVWEWGLLLDVLGIIIGIIGACIAIILPAGLALWGMLKIENSPNVNHTKTNILLFTLNAVCIYGLYCFSRLSYEVTKTHYGNYGEWIERTNVSIWSWNHLWMFIRPLVYFIGGLFALLFILIIGSYIVLGVSWLGKQIRRFFTT